MVSVPAWIGALVAIGVLVAATAAGLLLRRRNGRFRPVAASTMDPVLASLGVVAGTPVTLLQFSSAFCGPCRATRILCSNVASRVPGVRHIEVDAESNLDAARALDIWRTPTLLILDAEGTVRRRASGAPSRAQLYAAVAEVLPQMDLARSSAPE